MAKWTLCFLLFLPLTVCTDNEVTLVKTIGSKSDVTPICRNETLKIITLIVCKIRTERNEGEECSLLYHYERGFDHRCDSRFTLMEENRIVFLHLMRLTPVDSGNYTCECSHPDGTNILHLNITVEEDEDGSSSTQMLIQSALISVTMVIIITGVILVLIHGRIHHRRQQEPPCSCANTEPQDIEPYSTFICRESGLYSTARVNVSHTNANHSNMFTREDTHAGDFL